MDNLSQNFQNMMDYYIYSGLTFERLILPFIIVVVVLILLRIFLGFCLQIDTRVRAIKKLTKSFDNVAKQLSEQNQLLKDNIELNKKISEELEKIREDNQTIIDQMEFDVECDKTQE